MTSICCWAQVDDRNCTSERSSGSSPVEKIKLQELPPAMHVDHTGEVVEVAPLEEPEAEEGLTGASPVEVVAQKTTTHLLTTGDCDFENKIKIEKSSQGTNCSLLLTTCWRQGKVLSVPS
ncbi:unnamed protein product [Amoebophrya sp. A120]|nr:unnamed protein product [Amoebophrya sp. A120]|eukprot:GSA120T00007487001.1